MVSYCKGLSESFRNIYIKAGVQGHFKGASTVKECLVAPKDMDSIIQKRGVIYRYRCDQPECTMEYIEDTGRNFVERYKEYLRTPSPIFAHFQTT